MVQFTMESMKGGPVGSHEGILLPCGISSVAGNPEGLIMPRSPKQPTSEMFPSQAQLGRCWPRYIRTIILSSVMTPCSDKMLGPDQTEEWEA